MTDVLIDARRGAGSSLEILYGTVTWKPTLTHSRGTSIVLPAPTTYDLVDGQAVATNVQPTPEPVAGQIEWAYEVTFKDRHCKTYSFLVGVPDSTTQVNFISLPRYFETKPPLFGQGPKGDPGESATVAVGTVSGGTTAQVTNTGTNSDAILDFVLPEGPQGPPGMGVVDEFNTRNIADAPNTYPRGVIVGLYSASTMGWPYPSHTNVVTFSNTYTPAKIQILTPYNGAVGEPLIRFGTSSTTWSPLKPFRGDLATLTASGLMSAADKTLLDGMAPSANSKSFVELSSTYSKGFSVRRVQVADGWPLVGEGTLVTSKPITTSVGTVQWLYPDDGSGAQYRISDGSGQWTAFSLLITQNQLLSSGEVNVKFFGAKGDGVTNDDVAIATALDYATAKGVSKVVFPSGKYLISQPITVKSSNITLSGYGAELVGSVAPAILVGGTGLGEAANLVSQNVNRGASEIRLAKNSFAVGDTLMLVSQRVSTSLDTPSADRLGSETGDGTTDNGPYFGEFITVVSKDTTNASYDVMTLANTLNFNGYRINGTLDPSSDRLQTTAYKFNSAKDVIVEGFTLNVVAGTSVRVLNGQNVLVRDMTDTKNHNYGVTLEFANSYNCRAENIVSRFTYLMPASGYIYQRNVFKVNGSQDIIWEKCTSYLASQTFDVTYNRASYLITSLNVKFIGCKTYGSSSNSLTTHPGTSDIEVLDCDFTNGASSASFSGIGIRSPRVTISRTRIVGRRRGDSSGSLGNYGISLFDGPIRDVKIDGNYIEGFDRGIFIGDGSSAEKRNTKINATIVGNEIVKCFTGFATLRSSASIEDPNWEILFSANTVTSSETAAVGVWLDTMSGQSRGYKILNNQFDLTQTGSTGVRINHSVANVRIIGNSFSSPTGSKILQFSGGTTLVAHNMMLSIVGNSSDNSGVIELPIFTAVNTLSISGNDFGVSFPVSQEFSLDNYSGNYALVAPTPGTASAANGFPADGGACILKCNTGTGVVRAMEYVPLNATAKPQTRYKNPSSVWSAWARY